jgi:cation:H+ antiporter
MIALSILGGLAVLTAGAEGLVRGASRLALLAGISPLVVGLTVVAYGTSTPELVVSVKAALGGNPDIAVGNVVGSNIFNVLFILGVSALIAPLVVARQLVRLEVPIMIGVSVLLWVLALGGRLSRIEAIVLFAGIVAYTIWTIRRSVREQAAARATPAAGGAAGPVGGGAAPAGGAPPRGARAILTSVAFVAGGLVLLVVGGRWFVDGSIALARTLGVSDLVIGLTIVAAGTSMPEVATSILATIRGERDIAIGNVVGSNIYNILAILGFSAIIPSDGLAVAASMRAFDVPVMTAVAVACLPIFFTGYSIGRLEGLVFLGGYAAYTAYLILAAAQHDALDTFSAVMAWFVLPLTALGIGVSLWRALRGRTAPKAGSPPHPA